MERRTMEEKKLIEFRNIVKSFDSQVVLKGINLDIYENEFVTLLGPSGCGKTTLLRILGGFLDADEGKVIFDNEDITGKPPYERELNTVFQKYALFPHLNVFNNIAFGVENATMEQVIEAAKIANAHDFIMEKEDGYNTNIGDRGSKLSGGQRQRISIARAILKNPPILILDEATSALDTESERLVQEALERLMKTRTTIAIAHRLSTIKNADEICVLYEGEIVERGKHEELLALNGYYKRLNDMQSL